jgi:hypothetical protein
MNPLATVGTFAAGLLVVFGAAVGVGGAVGPLGAAVAEQAHGAGGGSTEAHGEAPSGADLAPGGLALAQDGYALRLERSAVVAGQPGDLRFTISGPDDRPVVDLTPTHDKDLHLIVVRRDLTGYQHLHPTRDATGLWTVPLTVAEPGPYKVFADFQPAGRDRSLTLGADLTAPGSYTPTPVPPASPSASVDGYDVSLTGRLTAGTSSRLVLSVSKDGRPVTDLQPYLAAYGHLVALRDGDLAYLHVHPDGELGDPGTRPGPDVTFYADVPAAATYRLFLDFQHAGVVRTAELTAVATPAGGSR